MPEPWPTEIKYSREKRTLSVSYDDGVTVDLPAQLLRVESPSAEVQGHSPSQKQIVLGKEQVEIVAVEPVGHYAVRLVFDDGHNTGIYTWSYFRELSGKKTG